MQNVNKILIWMLRVFISFTFFLFFIWLIEKSLVSFYPSDLEEKYYKSLKNTNSLGYRGSEFNSNKEDGTFRILFLGDSMTFGALNPDLKDTFPKKLELYLNQGLKKRRFEVFNISKGGWRTSDEIIHFLKHGVSLKPDLVFLTYFHNDIPDTDGFFREKCRTPIMKSLGMVFGINLYNLIQKTRLFELISPKLNWLLEKYDLKDSYPECLAKAYLTRSWEMQKIYFDTLDGYSKLGNFHFMIGIVPFIHNLKNNYPFLKAHSLITSYCKERKIRCIDFYEEGFKYEDEKELSAIYPDYHFNAKGNDILARILSEKLMPIISMKNLLTFNHAFHIDELLENSWDNELFEKKISRFLNNSSPFKLNRTFGPDQIGNIVISGDKNYVYFKKSVFLKSSNDKLWEEDSRLDRRGKLIMKQETHFPKNNSENGVEIKYYLEKGKRVYSFKDSKGNSFKKSSIYICDPLVFERAYFRALQEKDSLEEKMVFNNLKCLFAWKLYFDDFIQEALQKNPQKWFLEPLKKVLVLKQDQVNLQKVLEQFPELYIGL